MIMDDVISTYASETLTAVRSGFYPKLRYYLLNAPVANKTYCFHIDRVLPDPIGVPAVTTWTNTSVPFRAFCFDKSGNWYCAMASGVAKYGGYNPTGGNAYSIDWFALWDDFEDGTRLKHLKNLAMSLGATAGQSGTIKWKKDYSSTVSSAAFTCGATDFASGLGAVHVALGGSCSLVMFGISTSITGNKVTLHSMRAYAQPGATKIR